MYKKINIQDSRQAIMTITTGNDTVEATVQYTAGETISVGDLIGHPSHLKQTPDGVKLFRVESVLASRPCKGEWTSDRPTWYHLILKKETISYQEAREILTVRKMYDANIKREVEVFQI